MVKKAVVRDDWSTLALTAQCPLVLLTTLTPRQARPGQTGRIINPLTPGVNIWYDKYVNKKNSENSENICKYATKKNSENSENICKYANNNAILRLFD